MKPTITRPPVKPTSGSARWLTRPDSAGAGQLVLRTAAGIDRLYQTAALLDQGRLVGWSLTRLGTGETYHLDTSAEAWSCDCPAFTFTAHKRGPCKHILGLAAALRKIGWEM